MRTDSADPDVCRSVPTQARSPRSSRQLLLTSAEKNVPEDSATRRENAAKDAAPPAQTASLTRMAPPVSERVVHSSMLGAQLNCSVPPETVSVDPSANSA